MTLNELDLKIDKHLTYHEPYIYPAMDINRPYIGELQKSTQLI